MATDLQGSEARRRKSVMEGAAAVGVGVGHVVAVLNVCLFIAACDRDFHPTEVMLVQMM